MIIYSLSKKFMRGFTTVTLIALLLVLTAQASFA
jgi:hypothetical protein